MMLAAAVLVLALVAFVLFWALPALIVWGDGEVRFWTHVFRCWLFRGHCNPARTGASSGYRCVDCRMTAESLDGMLGFEGQGYVSPFVSSYERETRAFTRASRHPEVP